MKIVFIKELEVMALIGLYSWERKRSQKVIFDLEMIKKNQKYLSPEERDHFLDYEKVSKEIFSIVNNKEFLLIEDLAEKTVEELIRIFRLSWIRLKLSKFRSIPQAFRTGIIIERNIP